MPGSSVVLSAAPRCQGTQEPERIVAPSTSLLHEAPKNKNPAGWIASLPHPDAVRAVEALAGPSPCRPKYHPPLPTPAPRLRPPPCRSSGGRSAESRQWLWGTAGNCTPKPSPPFAGAAEPERGDPQRRDESWGVMTGFPPPLLNLLYKHGSISSRYRINTHLSFSSCNKILFLITL